MGAVNGFCSHGRICCTLFNTSEKYKGEAKSMKNEREKALRLFTLAVICIAVTAGFSSNIYTNYFKDAYNITSVQRGFLEIPRESPGILCMFIVAALSSMGDITIALLSQILAVIGLFVMGLLSPSYGIMMIFLFIASLGQHTFMPLNDSIAISLSEEGKVGQTLGKLKGYTAAVYLIASASVFVGFKTGFFSFKTNIIVPFVIALIGAAAAVIILFYMMKYSAVCNAGGSSSKKEKHKLVLRKQYMPYYLVTLAYGCQKRIKLVFGPWVIADLLLQGADTLALLAIIIHFVGMAFSPAIGKMLDRFGAKKSLLVEGIYIIISFAAMGYIAGGFADGRFAVGSPAMYAAFVVYILCYLFDQFSTVHSYLMRYIAIEQSDITATLSVGLSVDHVIAIVSSSIFGIIWAYMGAQYVFYICALSALTQIIVGLTLKARAQ